MRGCCTAKAVERGGGRVWLMRSMVPASDRYLAYGSADNVIEPGLKFTVIASET